METFYGHRGIRGTSGRPQPRQERPQPRQERRQPRAAPPPWASGLVAFAAALTALSIPSSAGIAADPVRRPVPPVAGGIMVNEPDHDRWVEALSEAGLDTVQVTLYARQGPWDSADLTFSRQAPAVVAEIRAAKRRGLRAVLVLRTYLEHGLEANRHLWHGMIWPRDEVLEEWFGRYREFVRWGARLARDEGVDILAIGNELSSLTSTALGDRLPDPYAYYLDPSRTAAVRERQVECAETVPSEWMAQDLSFLDGGRYGTLDAYLRAEERERRRWTAGVAGVDAAGLERIEEAASAAGPDAGASDPGRRVAETVQAEVDLEALRSRLRRYEAAWRAIAAEARSIYPGPVTYGANFDQVEAVEFWDALDLIGVNAYFPLSRWGLEGAALTEEMAARWRDVAGRLGSLAAGRGDGELPVVFLEMGWTRKDGSTVRPFSYTRVEVLETAPGARPAAAAGSEAGEGTVPEGSRQDRRLSPTLTCVHWATQPADPEERVLALRSLLDVVEGGHFPQLRGFLLWKLSTRPEHRDIEPFVVVLPRPDDAADRSFLRVAAALAAAIERQAGGHAGSRTSAWQRRGDPGRGKISGKRP